MLAYRDFAPRALGKAGWLGWSKGLTWETFDDALAAANSWIAGESVKVVTVETVVLPNIPFSGNPDRTVAEPQTSGGHSAVGAGIFGQAYWYQFVRVWYQK